MRSSIVPLRPFYRHSWLRFKMAAIECGAGDDVHHLAARVPGTRKIWSNVRPRNGEKRAGCSQRQTRWRASRARDRLAAVMRTPDVPTQAVSPGSGRSNPSSAPGFDPWLLASLPSDHAFCCSGVVFPARWTLFHDVPWPMVHPVPCSMDHAARERKHVGQARSRVGPARW
jgi:hypothetical protein